MTEIMDEFIGKLYDKAEIENWNLPERMNEQIQLKENKFFFLTTFREETHGMRHVHFSIYPTKYEMVYFILVTLPEIKPQILSNVITYLKKLNYDIFNSTGFCSQENNCFFGVYISFYENLDKVRLIQDIGQFENVQEVKIFKYTCIGCTEE